MTRLMYDGVTAANIPRSAQLVAGYVDGNYRWSDADWALFPDAVKVRIAVLPSTNDGSVLDVEPGNGTPDQAPPWVVMRRAAGVDPTVYCSVSDWPALQNAFESQGVPAPHWWVAAYPGIGQSIYPGAVAHQFTDNGDLYDISVVADHWPGIDSAPAPTPSPAPSTKDWFDMASLDDLRTVVTEVADGHKFTGAADEARAAKFAALDASRKAQAACLYAQAAMQVAQHVDANVDDLIAKAKALETTVDPVVPAG